MYRLSFSKASDLQDQDISRLSKFNCACSEFSFSISYQAEVVELGPRLLLRIPTFVPAKAWHTSHPQGAMNLRQPSDLWPQETYNLKLRKPKIKETYKEKTILGNLEEERNLFPNDSRWQNAHAQIVASLCLEQTSQSFLTEPWLANERL